MAFWKSDSHGKSHTGHIHYLSALKGIVGMLRAPERTESVFDIEDGFKDVEATQFAVDHAKRCSSVRELMEARYLAGPTDLDALRNCPDGSLGNAYVQHIEGNGFDPDYFRQIEVINDRDWMLMRMRQTHDLWHVVTGIGTSRIGELALKAFELGQVRRPMAAVICAGGVMRYLLKDADKLTDVLEGISTGYRMGVAANQLLGIKFEERWDEPLAELRKELNVCRGEAQQGALKRFEGEPTPPRPAFLEQHFVDKA